MLGYHIFASHKVKSVLGDIVASEYIDNDMRKSEMDTYILLSGVAEADEGEKT